MGNQSWAAFAKDVGHWSQANFGDQDNTLPLMGIAEEYGELQDALLERSVELISDSLADIAIYFCDFAERSQLTLCSSGGRILSPSPATPGGAFSSHYGKLVHVVLKRKQGIRKYADDQFYRGELHREGNLFLTALENLASMFLQRSLITVAKTVFDEQVSLRDWKANPEGDTE